MQNVFLSRPTKVEKQYQAGLDHFLRYVKTVGLEPRTVGSTDMPSASPLDEVIRVMRQCCGAIILGYPQLIIDSGRNRESSLNCPVLLPTEWNHIEAGLAHAQGLPSLVVRHRGVSRGIFDRGAMPAFLHEADFSDPAWAMSETISGALKSWKERLPAQPPMPGS